MKKFDIDSLTIGNPNEYRPSIRIPVYVKSEQFKCLWEQNVDAVKQYDASPRERWFAHGGQMLLGLFGFNKAAGYIYHSEGRHRTRWLMQQGLEYLPIYVWDTGYYDMFAAGLIHRRAFYGDPVNIELSECGTVS